MTSLYDLVDVSLLSNWLATHQRFKTWWLRNSGSVLCANAKTRQASDSGDYRQLTKMILVDEADNFMRQTLPV